MNQEELYYTVSMYEAATILSCQNFEADYEDILPPPPRESRNRFVLKVYTDANTLKEFCKDYRNGRVLIEPKTYDEKINMLRDILKKEKGLK